MHGNRRWKLTAVCIVALFGSACPASRADEPAESDKQLLDRWALRTAEQLKIDAACNARIIMLAVHNYCEAHGGALPPIAVPNGTLPFEKRLSGFVLLLPYVGEKPSYVSDQQWKLTRKELAITDELMERAKELHKSISQDVAWDDPCNLEAARTVLPFLLAPGSAPLRENDGFAVSHFAFIRGCVGIDNGVFTEEPVTIGGISDGTSKTLAIGQIVSRLGPWIAAGTSSSRYVYGPGENVLDNPTLGGPTDAGWIAAIADSSTVFVHAKKADTEVLYRAVGRADRTFTDFSFISPLPARQDEKAKSE
jgi:hypothetical protein